MKKTIAVAGATLLTVLAGAGAASAATTNSVSVDVVGGGLNLSAIQSATDFDQVSLTEATQNVTSDLTGNFVVDDFSGDHAGWKLQVSATELADGAESFPAGSLQLGAVDTIANSSGATPAVAAGEVGVIDGTAKSVVTAAPDTGQGKNTFAFEADALKLQVDPAQVKAGSYTSVISWDLVAGL